MLTKIDMISTRGRKMIGEPSPLVVAHFKCVDDKFHPETNPNGKISLGTAENHLMDAEMLAMVNQPLRYSAQHLHYGQSHGTPALQQAIAEYMGWGLGISDVIPDNVAVAGGASAILEAVAMSLFEDGEALITPSPLYSGFIHDFSTRFNVNIVPHPLPADNQYALEIDGFKRTIEEAMADGIGVKAILICSPQNPLGITYTDHQLAQIVETAKEYKLDIIADELYAQSVYEGEFKSLLEIGKDYRQHIHFVYSFAKDFVLSGFKVGMFYSENAALKTAVQEIAYFHPVSTHTQRFLENLLANKAWCQAFSEQNKAKLLTASTLIKNLLKSELNIACIEANAGIFVWADFSAYLEAQTFEAERELFETLFDECGVSISPGQYFRASTPGWFRICYAQEAVVVETAVSRMKRILY